MPHDPGQNHARGPAYRPEAGGPDQVGEEGFASARGTRMDVGSAVAAADLPLPPLREVMHGGIVPNHVGVDASDLPPVAAKAGAHLRLFSREDRRVEGTDLS